MISQTARASWEGLVNTEGKDEAGGAAQRFDSPSYSMAVWHKRSDFRVIPIQQITYSGSASNGLNSSYVATTDIHGNNSGRCSGTKVEAYDVGADKTVTVPDVSLSAIVNPAGATVWSYSAPIIPISFQHSSIWSNGNTFPTDVQNRIGIFPPYGFPTGITYANPQDPDAGVGEYWLSFTELKAGLPASIGDYIPDDAISIFNKYDLSFVTVDANGQVSIPTIEKENETDPPFGADVIRILKSGYTVFLNDAPGVPKEKLDERLEANVVKVIFTHNFTSQLTYHNKLVGPIIHWNIVTSASRNPDGTIT